jgi:hypothetical protein
MRHGISPIGHSPARPDPPRMASLAALQQHLQAYLLSGAPAIAEHIVGTPRVPAARRLAIYANAYRSRLGEALASNYPALAELLGPVDFRALAHAYIAANDSRFFSLRWYGHALEEFLANDARYRATPLLAELARWEWAMSEAFDAADAEPIGAARLAGIPPESWAALRFDWHPSVRVLALYWNAPQIWKALSEARERPPAEVHGEPQPWLVWRHDLSVHFRSLTAAESRLVALARYGSTFGQLCDALCADIEEEEAAAQAAARLADWVASGLITSAAART